MKMCKEYWYDYSLAVVDRKNTLNYVNHKTNERETPKSPQKLVTLIETVARPGGLFILDGVPISRSHTQVERFARADESKSRLILQHFPQSPVRLSAMERKRSTLHLSHESSRAVSAGHTRDSSSHEYLDHHKPFPIWDKYYNRHPTPKNELVQQSRRLEREDAIEKMRHVYWDDNFLKAPVENDAAATFTRLYLPSERSIESVRRRTGGATLIPTAILEKQRERAVAKVTERMMESKVVVAPMLSKKNIERKKRASINNHR